eukprot:CAMPEP_0173257120 /NCGR_PEP_ID=MMETSP1142-20121109/23587_1 /TAXON_ID=483371 /ORGANISM="non described non described, Strain CCMP2298" /LENGTH=51 /DNA_ID=CAMNT_0014191201 /DNA_START=37 /DNA_END=189 /DNA_ORIENTATION=-
MSDPVQAKVEETQVAEVEAEVVMQSVDLESAPAPIPPVASHAIEKEGGKEG